MIKQVVYIKDKWKVIVYYNINCDLFNYVYRDLKDLSLPIEEIDDIHFNMSTHKTYAFTYSNINKRTSIVGFNKHCDKAEYISSIIHEAEHVKQHILYYYKVKDAGEPPAYLIGYLVSKLYNVFKKINI